MKDPNRASKIFSKSDATNDSVVGMPRGGFSLAVEAPPAVPESDDDEVSVVSAPAVSSELLADSSSAAAGNARYAHR